MVCFCWKVVKHLYDQMRDWYDVSKNDITRVGGGALFKYHPSLVHALQDLYPDYPWQPSRFVPAAGKPVAGHWQQRDNLHAQLGSAEKLLGITQVLPHTCIVPSHPLPLFLPLHSPAKSYSLCASQRNGTQWRSLT